MKDPFKIFDLNDFKKWMNQPHDQKKEFIGIQVESKVSTKKLLDVCDVIEGNDKKVIKEFNLNGGTVLSNNGNSFIIENKKGKFEIHKMYLKLS